MKHKSITFKFTCGEKELAEAARYFKIKKATREHYRKLIRILIQEGEQAILNKNEE